MSPLVKNVDYSTEKLHVRLKEPCLCELMAELYRCRLKTLHINLLYRVRLGRVRVRCCAFGHCICVQTKYWLKGRFTTFTSDFITP